MSDIGRIVERQETVEHRNSKNLLHREDGPAIIYKDGSQHWYINGRVHRDGGPAILDADGSEEWYRHGVIHREDGPAIIDVPHEVMQWWINGMLHREDGPAYVLLNEDESFNEWFLVGVEVEKELVKSLDSLTIETIHKQDNLDLRSFLINRFGWAKYLRKINAKPIDFCDNLVEGTKEALYKVKGIKGKQLIVTCPTGRIFNLHVPDRIKTCEQAQSWLGNDTKKKYNVIGRT